ncbi:hydrocephalus-inducing protein homolog [Protopterus annectens]|uniref:hydrocephalus-inducing protein homolog n=1 Tax=Protopterus annectens TaxID=7888 RepID=UPI001CF9EAD9|nr:hydrocephalus-inducing protein homolog [Protopterus annectens]
MPTGRVEDVPSGTLQSLSFKMPEGFKSKVVAPRNPKLVKRDEQCSKLTPSMFMKEMSLTTEQKLANTHEMYPPRVIEILDMSETTYQKSSFVEPDQTMFQPFPSEIVFQNFVPCETYEVPLILRNNDKVPRLVKVVEEKSPYFSVISPNDVCNKVAPGMASVFRIQFFPEENKDYGHELICITEKEKFVIPIRAVGARAMLDFPDQVNFSSCPVKYNSQKTLLVRNVGNKEAKFHLQTVSPFTVQPKHGTLAVGESAQVAVDFLPQQIGDYSVDMVTHLDTGENIYTNLCGAAIDMNVRLEKNSVMIEKTYLSMANQRSVNISNRSDFIVHFQWKAFATQEEEDHQKLRFCSDLKHEEQEETERFLLECTADPTLHERISILSRTFMNRRRMVDDDTMLFSDDIISLEPVEGDIWPNSSAEINVIFKPREAKIYQYTVYCDITGRETRLPLRIKGEGIGPKVTFSYDVLDMGNIFVGAKHSYEIILANKGEIDAIFSVVSPPTVFGQCFMFNPNEGIILPRGHQAMEVTFQSSILGDFVEDFFFSVDGSPDKIKVTFRGCVIGPTFHFSMPALNFGDVSFGFPQTLTCSLSNTSLVPMTFHLHVPGDGPGDQSITSFDWVSDSGRRSRRNMEQRRIKPKEFTIIPDHGMLRPQGLIDIQVTLCSNEMRQYELALVVDVDGVGPEVLAVPIIARCIVPHVNLLNPVIELGRCFLRYPYQHMLKLANETDFPACYGVIPQEFEDQPAVVFSSPQPRRIIGPHTTAEILLVVEAHLIGEQDAVAYLTIFGSEKPPMGVHLLCIGEGPVVHVTPTELDFGKIPVLTDISRTLHLSNQSPIPAPFLAQMVRTHSQWSIHPSEGVIPAEGELNVTLVVHLDDTLGFEDKMHLAVKDSQTYSILVKAFGVGTTIVADRPLAPALNLGAHYSSGPCRYYFKLTNKGRRFQRLYWMTEGFPQFRKHIFGSSDVKGKGSLPSLELPKPTFRLYPVRMELHPGEAIDVMLEGSSDTPRVVKERLLCHAIIGRQSGKEKIMTVDVTCEFIAPVLQLSTQQLTFSIKKLPSDVLLSQYKPLILKSVSSLPMSILLSLKEPFAICDKQGAGIPESTKAIRLSVNEEVELSVKFDPTYKDDFYSWVAEEILTIQYHEHPHREYVSLRGEVHFPNLYFESMVVDFGCILNDTEVVRHIEMTNCSPLPVKFHWSFLLDDWESQIRSSLKSSKMLNESHEAKGHESGMGRQLFQRAPAAIADSNRRTEVFKPPEGDLEGREKTDAENETREGRGSPKETLSDFPLQHSMREEEVKLLENLKRDNNLRFMEPDKEGGLVIFNQTDYKNVLTKILAQDSTYSSASYNEIQTAYHRIDSLLEEYLVFDILPLYGLLQPNEIQKVELTFYGHANITGQVTALCEVEGGPTYKIQLKGEASLVCYAFDKKEIDYGHQLFDHVTEAEITLANKGQVGFNFSVLNTHQDQSPNGPQPGVPFVVPPSGFIKAHEQYTLKVFYLPGVPEAFHKTFEIQVSHFEPDIISLMGEGIFPRITLDLPRNIKGNENYLGFLKRAKETLENVTYREEVFSRPQTVGDQSAVESISSHDVLLQMEMERLIIREHALEQQSVILSSQSDNAFTSQKALRKLVKAQLPEYILDFGYVVHGTVKTHIVKVTNTGVLPVSFRTDRQCFSQTGFTTELDRVLNLPYCETETFEVRFDPRGANLSLGVAETRMPLKTTGGPIVHILLRAVVTMPFLTVSSDKLEFGAIQCGQCQVLTIQLYNPLQVECEWTISDQQKQKKQPSKHMPVYLQRKILQDMRPKLKAFEMLPPNGRLLPGQRMNIQIKFTPKEEKLYNQRLTLYIAQSSHRVMLLAQGQGLEPQLNFTPAVLEFGPVLPYSPGEEADILVKNPCNFPIEFYSLEYDKQYIEEEKILRMMKGYDAQNTLLLPTRGVGEKLPPELFEYYEEQKRIREEQMKNRITEATVHESGLRVVDEDDHLSEFSEKQEVLAAISTPNIGASPRPDKKSIDGEDETEKLHEPVDRTVSGRSSINTRVGELESNPVSKAIARHLGIDLSPEGLAARNRRGISIIVHGAPLSGKTNTAITLAKHYGAACLTVDGIILEAISNGNTPTGLRARELCAKAAAELALHEADEAAILTLTAETSNPPPQQAQTPGLSIEAVAKHTFEGSQVSENTRTGLHSAISKGNKTSIVGGKGRADVPITQSKQHHQELTGSQGCSTPFPSGLIQRRLSVSASVAGEAGLLSCVLPSDLLVDILAERLQLSDCHRGVVFDGLETLYSRSLSSTLQCILRAVNNRRYIFFINLKQTYASMNAREKAKREEEEHLLKEKQERERIFLKEMDEEEYDAMSEEEKAEVDRRRLEELRARKKREQEEKLAKELEYKKLQEELERQREEEEMRKKSKKGKRDSGKEEPAGKKATHMAGKQGTSAGTVRPDAKADQSVDKRASIIDRPESVDHADIDEGNKKKKGKDVKVHLPAIEMMPPLSSTQEEAEREPQNETEKLLILRFKNYESSQKEVLHVLELWDRVQGVILNPSTSDGGHLDSEDQASVERHPPSGKKARRDREKERQEKLEREKAEKERLEKERVERERLKAEEMRNQSSPNTSIMPDDVTEGTEREEHDRRSEVGVPHINMEVTGPEYPSGKMILNSLRLPPLEEILDGLGIGPKGPPVPPSSIFSMVPYPAKRLPPTNTDTFSHFVFVALLPDNPCVAAEDKKEAETDQEKSTSISVSKEEEVIPVKGKSKKDKADTGRDSQKEKRRPPSQKKGHLGSDSHSPPPGRTLSPLSDAEQSSTTGEVVQDKITKLTTFRWIVPANGEITLKIHFFSQVVGQFDQTLSFEILGTRRRYQIYCRGVCAFPSICQDPKVVFRQRLKVETPDAILHKKYVMSKGMFEFGPLLCGKSRERYKEGKYPENMEKLQIVNKSPMDAEISFCFQYDQKAATFLLDPPGMTLKPNEKKELSVWAYPTSPGLIEDNIVCCVRENPEPLVFKISCQGVRPELELDRKQIHFDKILLHRKDTKTLFLRNSMLLPVAWRITGLENLGDDFMVSQDQGIILPKSEFSLHLHFRAMKAVNAKKVIRLEVSDVENILGIVQTENIQIFAEAYDVALDISFPKGADGGLDFGVIRVTEEAKFSLSLRNKGKYEIGYSFILEASEPMQPDLNTLFTVQPPKGSLGPSDRPTQVAIIFKSIKEVSFKDQPILRCQVIEPNLGEGGLIIAKIPVKVSARAVFSKYSISPSNDINFGALVIGTRKSGSFNIENKGELEFRYSISKMVREIPIQHQKRQPGAKRTRSREGSTSGKSVALNKPKRSESLQKDIGTSQARFTLGMFTVFPGFGIIPPGSHQNVSVECAADPVGKSEESLAIDISDRDPDDQPNGIPYWLIAEACMPAIAVDDIASVFEEHRLCKSISLFQCLQAADCCGIYVVDENKFIFNNVLVGRQAKARFKIINNGKVPCDVVLSVKPVFTSRTSARVNDIFEVEPSRMCVPSHCSLFAVVTFSPQTMQSYQCLFEAAVDGMPSSISKSKNLVFDIVGEGNLPRVTIVHPILRNKSGNHLLLFKKLLLGRSETLPLHFKNDGSIPAQVNIDLFDEPGVFTLKPCPKTRCIYSTQNLEEDAGKKLALGKKTHAASLVLNPGESVEFEVIFKASIAQRCSGLIRLTVLDNQYDETVVWLVAEGFQDDITLDNIHGLMPRTSNEYADGQLEQDDVEAARMDHIQFGDCHIGKAYQVTFTMTNHSKTEAVKFEWPTEVSCVRFCPQVGHLHAACAKDITISFKSDSPLLFDNNTIKCKICKISFQQPIDQIKDWDDRLRTVKWVDCEKSQTTPRPAKKKVIETDPEPEHIVVEESVRELELRISAVVNYAQYKCKTESIRFRDTLIFQTRIYEFTMSNNGNVQLEYSWQLVMEGYGKAVSFVEGQSQYQEENSSPDISANQPESRIHHAASRSGSVESKATYPFNDTDIPVFSVEPCRGFILPGKKSEFQVKFSPLEVGEFEGRLICSIPNLKREEQGPVLSVKGHSLLPYCHFELEESDYLSSNKRIPDLQGLRDTIQGSPLDPNTRVIEITSVGVYTRNCRSFNIINPTSSIYSFKWICNDPVNLGQQPTFRCLSSSGNIMSGKTVVITFEFIPQQLGITESFWTFLIPEQSISVPFLLVGKVSEPVVSLDRSHLNFRAVLIGQKTEETVYMINNEKQEFKFVFEEYSTYSEGHTSSLMVQPMEGTVSPLSRIPIIISFTPTTEGEVNFNLVCDVKGKTENLSLNVKAECYSMSATVQCETSEQLTSELGSQTMNKIFFKEVELNECATQYLNIYNNGKFNLEFLWKLFAPKDLQRYLNISPDSGSIKVGQQSRCVLTFLPLQPCTLKDTELQLKIQNGPVFKCILTGCAVAPGVHFSFTKHDFGASFIYHAGMPLNRCILVITNKEEREISLDCLFTNTSHLGVAFQSEILSPKGTLEVPITFYPREAMQYHETIIFEINGLSRQNVEVLGQGTEMKLEVVEPQNKVVNFGAVRVQQTVRKIVSIVNKSLAPLIFTLAINPSLQALQDSKVLRMSPAGEISLKPRGGTCSVEVLFSPKCRISQFMEEVMFECAGMSRLLFVLRGCCQGVEVSLDQEQIPFGAVILRSQVTRRLLMQNTGDIGVRFKWDIKKFEPDFTITPVEGYISPGMDVIFDVTFHPLELNQDIRYEGLSCMIEGSKPLKLTLNGSCVSIPTTKEVVNFNCHVRTKQAQTIILANRSNQTWMIQPLIEGEHWKGAEMIAIEAHQQKPYEITYRPLTMTLEGKKHQGSVFFPLPDGTGLLYVLQGNSEPPKASGTVNREVPCKTSYTELLSVTNWLQRPQRFRILLEMLKPEKLESSTTLKGLDYIDVPALSKKDYKLTFFSHKEGIFSAKVTFRNEATQEYLYYLVTFRATPPGVLSTIEMTTTVRQSTSATVKVDNPLSSPVTFTTDCKSAEINLPPQFTVPAQSEGTLTFEFQPLRTGESTARLSLQSSELGSFQYDLSLKALAAGPEKPLYFRSALGGSQTLTAKFISFTRQKVEYSCKIDNPEFHVEKTINAAPGSQGGTEVSVDVAYEPCSLSESRSLLNISSPIGGEYNIPLFGTCTPPKPQGPFVIRAGSSTSIPFKNIFQQTTVFAFQLDNPAFATKPSETIRSKKTHNAVVSFEGNPSGSKASVTGKLTISCPRTAGVGQNVTWLYYLKGVTPEK